MRRPLVIGRERLAGRVDAEHERPARDEDPVAGDRATGRQRTPDQHRRSLPQLQGGVHRLVILLFVLDDHARGEQVILRGALKQVKHPAVHLVVVRFRLDLRRQRRPVVRACA